MADLSRRAGLKLLQKELKARLEAKGADGKLIRNILASGYYTWPGDPTGVRDALYGKKLLSSCFQLEAFVDYAMGAGNSFQKGEFKTFVIKSRADAELVLSEPERVRYLKEGSMTFRGQPEQHFLKRPLPNPVQSNENGEELSILPGAYRQRGSLYSFNIEPVEQRITDFLPPHLFTGPAESAFAYDSMRVEQHYAKATRGLDLSFDLDVALFFATHRYTTGNDGKASYQRVPAGNHRGVVYAFCFGSPPVKAASFLIREFDLFKDHTPERVLRQNCGLPLFSDYERNIAITDLDCILQLDADYSTDSTLTAEHLFPSVREDKFYAALLEQKDKHPASLTSVVEYEWAR